MHPLLQLDEIQRLIFKFLEPRDLARLAQTCKAFFHTATDELWNTIHSLSPFLSCLPPDFQYQYRKLQVEELQRCDFYLPKVHNLSLESITLPQPFQHKRKSKLKKKTWEELWEEIAKLRPKLGSLLNLRRLRISNVQDRLLIPLIGVSGSNLTQIRIELIHNRRTPSVIRKVLDGIHYTPKLESLYMRRDNEDNETYLVDLIRQSPLRHIRLEPQIGYLSPQHNQSPFLYDIFQKSTLRNLTLRLTRDWYSPEITALNSRYLPALKVLWLDLTAFEPKQCEHTCVNVTTSSWTCRSATYRQYRNLQSATNCGRRSPTIFLKGLDSPELSLLNIKFPIGITGRQFLNVVSAVTNSCRFTNMTELALAGREWSPQKRRYGHRPRPQIRPADLRTSLSMFLPLPQLKVLRLSVAPNFLDVLDLKLYQSLTAGLRTLETLSLGHTEFYTMNDRNGPKVFYERVPLHNLAAFCSMLRNLKEVSVGTIDGLTLKKHPFKEWACIGVKALWISHYADVYWGENLDLLVLGLGVYFPNTGLAHHPLYRREYMFRRR